MKRRGLFVLGLLVLVTIPLSAISLCDYHSPETSLTDVGMSMNYRYFDDGGTPEVDVNSGRVEVDFSHVYDSPSLGGSFAGLTRMSLVDYVPSNLLAQASGSVRYYFDKESAWYAFGGTEGSATLATLTLDLQAGAGYGRFTDVTPMAKAVDIGERLLELGVIEVELSDDALKSIAEEIGRRAEYVELRDLVQSIEDAIEGEASVELGSQALLWIEEIVERSGDTRKCGWTIQGGVGYELFDPDGVGRDVLFALSADAAWSISSSDAAIVHAGLSGPLASGTEIRINVNAAYEREVTEDVRSGLRLAWQRVDPASGTPTNTWTASATVAFELDRKAIGLQASIGRDPGDPKLTAEFSVSASIDLL